MTQSGVVAGTPHYMAPEQARAEATDHRADLFSLGSTLYAMCDRRAPVPGRDAGGRLRRVSDDEPRPIRELNPEIPGWLEAIVDRLHAKDPADRFASASEVADLLGQLPGPCPGADERPCLPSELVAAKAKTRSSGWTRRRAIGAAFLAVPVAAGAGFAYRVSPGRTPAAGSGRRRGGRPASSRTDEDPFREVRDRAHSLEADLRRPADPPDEDRVSDDRAGPGRSGRGPGPASSPLVASGGLRRPSFTVPRPR